MHKGYAGPPHHQFAELTSMHAQVTRQRANKVVEAATTRRKVTFDAKAGAAGAGTEKAAKPKRRGSAGAAVDAATGKPVEAVKKRQSRRESTVLNTKVLHTRLKDAEKRKVCG